SYPDRSEDEGLSALPEAERISYLAFHRSILPTLLRNFDRASMSSGVEIRMPYMDWRLVTYAFSLPAESRVGKAYTKRILRDAMFGLMPENIRSRKLKLGLSAPTPEWLLGPLRGYIMDTVNSTSFLKSKIWNGPAIRDFTEERMKDRAWGWDDCGLLWPCINAHILMKGK
ncbi:MAG: hypothetical protein JW946_01860, partial [Candidatus Omnitrophica bacterium]|nr:hypothetical protein [Candidatus Omnitrophota bacterium]